MSRTVLLAEIMHETNTFNRIPTTQADFETRYWLEGDDIPRALAGTNTEMCAFIDAASERGWTAVHPLAASASPSGPMAAADWQRVIALITGPLHGQKFDAVVLALHGAMVSATTLDAEGELLQTVRAATGPETHCRGDTRHARQCVPGDDRQCRHHDGLSHLSSCRSV